MLHCFSVFQFRLLSILLRICCCEIIVARRGAHLAAERGGAKRRQGARRSVAVPNGEGVASGSATLNILNFYFQLKKENIQLFLTLLFWLVLLFGFFCCSPICQILFHTDCVVFSLSLASESMNHCCCIR